MKPNQRFQNLTRTSMLSTTIRESLLQCFLFSSHESVLPREPPSEQKHAPFGKIFDFDTDSMSLADSSRLNYMRNIDQENELRVPNRTTKYGSPVKGEMIRIGESGMGQR